MSIGLKSLELSWWTQTITSVDTQIIILENVVEDVAVAEAERRCTGVEVKPVVQSHGHSDFLVFGTVFISVRQGMPSSGHGAWS